MKWAIVVCGMALTVALAGTARADDDGWGIQIPSNNTKTTTPTDDSSSSSSTSTGGTGIELPEVTMLNAAKKILAKAEGEYDAYVAAKKVEFEATIEYTAASNWIQVVPAAIASAISSCSIATTSSTNSIREAYASRGGACTMSHMK